VIHLDCDVSALRGAVHFDYRLARCNSWRVGGAGDCFFAPRDADDLARFLADCAAGHPVTCLGLGSNVLIRDGGVRGIVISMRKGFDRIEQVAAGRVRAGAGATCAQLARYCADAGLEGLEFMAGIPGTLGGALCMNAGAFGGETWRHVALAETLDRAGARRERAPADFDVGYRRVGMPGEEWFTGAEFALRAGASREALRARLKELLRERNRSQPVGAASCGSVFRNPQNDHAARLIEQCGLKSCSIGGAEVSALHANFIVNRGDATAADIERLIERVRDTVERDTGVRLQTEVRIIGEKA